MIGLIIKVCIYVALIPAAVIGGLHVAKVVQPGTVSFSQPDPATCPPLGGGLTALNVDVRWQWHPKHYGWGCVYEDSNGTTHTIAPIPGAK